MKETKKEKTQIALKKLINEINIKNFNKQNQLIYNYIGTYEKYNHDDHFYWTDFHVKWNQESIDKKLSLFFSDLSRVMVYIPKPYIRIYFKCKEFEIYFKCKEL
jgi:hypothetical protein